VAIAGAAAFSPVAYADSETVIYSFPNESLPLAPLTQMADGTLLGIERGVGYGALFRLTQHNGTWKEKELYRFPGNVAYPSHLIEHAGALYGVSGEGGQYGAGTVFSLTHAGARWTPSVLYSFTGGEDGSNPGSPLLWEKNAGAFFGVTPANISASPNCGTIFSITPQGLLRTLHLFKSDPDGCTPEAGLREIRMGKTIMLVGTTASGGHGNGGGGFGTVFSLTEDAGLWHESVIYTFSIPSGNFPGDFVVDKSGNIFGVTYTSGPHDQGTVFELSNSGGQWVEKTIYAFFGRGPDGENPAGLCQDSATGNLYGVTSYGGTYSQGTVFELTPANGSWTETILHNFGAPGDGGYPRSRPIFDPQARVLYGTTQYGGQFDGGVAYAISLSGRAAGSDGLSRNRVR
jgi:uncharacterized repeat protein (TIGR03803 family)